MPTFITIVIIFVIAFLGSGCQTTTSTTANTSSGTTSSSNSTAKAVEPQPRTQAADVSTIGSLATPTEAYKTGYELRRKKDIVGLKKVMSKDILEFLTLMGEDENKSLDDMLREMVEKPQADKAEVRKEKINGDRAELEYLTETGSWKTMDFEKVDGKWLLSFPKVEKHSGTEPEL